MQRNLWVISSNRDDLQQSGGQPDLVTQRVPIYPTHTHTRTHTSIHANTHDGPASFCATAGLEQINLSRLQKLPPGSLWSRRTGAELIMMAVTYHWFGISTVRFEREKHPHSSSCILGMLNLQKYVFAHTPTHICKHCNYLFWPLHSDYFHF